MTRVMLLSTLVVVSAWGAEPTRILLAVGSNFGDGNDRPLRYANTDAMRFRDVMVELGAVKPERAFLLEDATALDVRTTLREIKGRADELTAAGGEVTFFLYVSSHARGGALRLKGSQLKLRELRELTAAISAALKVTVVDTCESGAAARPKGGELVALHTVGVERVALRGEILISSSGPEEASEEWDTLGGSLFTHHLLTGLRGDADLEEDGRITLNEAYAYAYRRTVVGSARGAQHPMADIDVTGQGELTLTEPLRTRSAVVFEASTEGTYVVSSQPQPAVLLEVEKAKGRVLRLAVPAGRYLVRKRMGQSVAMTELNLSFGGDGVVTDAQLVKRNITEVAIKGGAIELRESTLFVLATLQTNLVPDGPAEATFGLEYRHTFGEWWVSGAVGAGPSQYRGERLTIFERHVLAEVAGGFRFVRWPVVPYSGVALRLWFVSQSVTRDDEAAIQEVFGVSALPRRDALGVAPTAIVGFEIPLPWRFTAQVQGGLEARFLPVMRNAGVAAASPWAAGFNGSVLLGVRF